MKKTCLLLCSTLLLLLLSCRPAPPPEFPAGRIVDLSYAYDEQTVFWPTAEGFKLDKVAEGMTPDGYYYA
ncbi:MAG: hypothetical protein ACR2G4_09525, partial [Pyrinomonadaceae bacterium]